MFTTDRPKAVILVLFVLYVATRCVFVFFLWGWGGGGGGRVVIFIVLLLCIVDSV